MEKNKKNIHDMSAQEEWELRSALIRDKVDAPDVDKEWHNFLSSHRTSATSYHLITSPRGGREGALAPRSSLPAPRISIKTWLSIAAMLAVLAGGWYWYQHLPLDNQHPTPRFTIDAQYPASSTQVVLTSADGARQMEGDINLQPSTSTQRKKAKMLALTTPCGHDYHLTLADGTEVWLNAESRLEFPDVFDKSAREVRLHGEAYFQVAKDAKHPFIVQVLPQENSAEGAFRTRVLGTQFNIRAYHPKDISVTLIEGKVCVEAADDKQVLAPHQQWAMHNGMQSVKTVDTYPLTQWKEGFFYFDNQTLLQIMQQLAHWYNVNVAFDDPSKTKVRLHFVTERNNSLAETLRQLNDLHVADISLSHNVIVVK